MNTPQNTAIPELNQRYMAFEGLLAWAKSIVRQANRVSRTQDRIKETIKQFPREPGTYNAETIRDAGHDFKVERICFVSLQVNFLITAGGSEGLEVLMKVCSQRSTYLNPT